MAAEKRVPSRSRKALLAMALLLALALLPLLAAAGVGRLLADLWVTTMSALFGLFAGAFGN